MTSERGLLTVEEAARYLTLGRSMTYRLIQDGTLPSIRLGRCRRAPLQALDRFIANHLERDVVKSHVD